MKTNDLLETIYNTTLYHDLEDHDTILEVRYKPFSRQFYSDMNEIHVWIIVRSWSRNAG